MVPISVALGWVNSVPYVSALSIYALITGHLSTWQAARVEVRQEQEEMRRDQEFEKRLERKLDDLRKALDERIPDSRLEEDEPVVDGE